MLNFLDATDVANKWSVLQTLITTAIPAVVTLVTFYITNKKVQATKDETSKQTPVIQTTHTLVNGRMTAALERISALEEHNSKLEALVRAAATTPAIVVPPANPPAAE